MRFLVIGGTGFIGSHVVEHLLAAGHIVTVVARGAATFAAKAPGAQYLALDYRQTESLRPLLAQCDGIIHLASTTVPGTGDLDPKGDVQDNLIPMIGLIEAMRDAGVARLVYFSSGGTVYGMPERVPVREDHPLRPISSYAIVKVAAEAYIDRISRTCALSPIILRPSNPYGPRQGREGSQGLVNTLMQRARRGEEITIWGDGSVVRDYLHVDDLARLCRLAAESPATGVLNAGSGTGTSVREMIGLIAEVTQLPVRVTYAAAREVDVPASILDARAARSVLGWEPQIALRDGLADTWAWVRANPS